jgi:two-component system, OmpR family, alkaline phosphatase synthesis response regulator PhoP
MSKILLVEDEPSILNLVSMNLLARGYEVVTATNGGEAIEQLDEEKPELMILDIRMPDVSGWEVLEYMNEISSSSLVFPVVVMTASVMNPEFVISQYPCVAEVFIKPFDINSLMSSVQHVLSEN